MKIVIFAVIFTLIASGIYLVLFEAFCTWRLWKYGRFNTNLRFDIYSHRLRYPRMTALPLGVLLFIGMDSGWSLWLIPQGIGLYILNNILILGLSYVCIYTYVQEDRERRKKEVQAYMEHEDLDPVDPEPRKRNSVVEKMEPIDLDSEPIDTRKRTRASVE